MNPKTPAFLAAILTALSFAPAAPAQMRLGVNVNGGSTYWDGHVFADLLRQSGGWTTDGNAATPFTLTLDSAGWPLSAEPRDGRYTACETVVSSVNAPLPAGDYTVAADGRGQVDVSWDYGPWQPHVFDDSGKPLTLRAAAPAVKLTRVAIRRSDAAAPLRNIRVYFPGAAVGHPFRPEYLEELKGYSLLRFMDARAVNNSKHVKWSDYLDSMRSFSNVGRGWPIEDCTRLANLVGADAWFCIPYRADADYIANMAKAIDSTLAPGKTVYIELSNELWNWQFMQSQDTLTEQAALAEPKPSIWAYQGQVQARKVNAFKAALPPTRRCVRVVSAQAAYPAAAKGTLDAAAAAGEFDAISCAPYFYHKLTDAQVRTLAGRYNAGDQAAKDACVAELMASAADDMADRLVAFAFWRDYARSAGKPLVLYEAGQHLVPPAGAGADALFAAAQRSPLMGRAYSAYLASLAVRGVDAAVLYAANGKGWGLKEQAGEPDAIAPKYRAVREALRD